jgi:hypothetical protein
MLLLCKQTITHVRTHDATMATVLLTLTPLATTAPATVATQANIAIHVSLRSNTNRHHFV